MNTKETRFLPCPLSEGDIKARISEMEQLNINVGLINQMEANYKEEIRLARAHNAERIRTISKEIQKRTAVLPVECQARPNFAKAHMEIVRLDTGKVLDVVPMTAGQASIEFPATTFPEAQDDGQNHADVLEGKA